MRTLIGGGGPGRTGGPLSLNTSRPSGPDAWHFLCLNAEFSVTPCDIRGPSVPTLGLRTDLASWHVAHVTPAPPSPESQGREHALPRCSGEPYKLRRRDLLVNSFLDDADVWPSYSVSVASDHLNAIYVREAIKGPVTADPQPQYQLSPGSVAGPGDL